MSTPERQQDPGEHGYGGIKQDAPAGDEQQGPIELPAYPLEEPGDENPLPGGKGEEPPAEQQPDEQQTG